jgi:hypothetical protein
MKLVTAFWRNSHVPLGTTRQSADDSWLTDEHSSAELPAEQHGTVGFPSLHGIVGAPHHQARHVPLFEREWVQNITTRQGLRNNREGPRHTFNYWALMDSVLRFNHLNDAQCRIHQNLPPLTTWQLAQLATCTNPKNQIIYLFSLPTSQKEAECCCYYDLPGVLTCPKYPMCLTFTFVTVLMQDLQINSLTRELFRKGVMVTWTDIKLFHKFIHNCGLVHIPSPREKQYSNNNYHFFSVSLFVRLFVLLGLELRAHPFSHCTSPICVMEIMK